MKVEKIQAPATYSLVDMTYEDLQHIHSCLRHTDTGAYVAGFRVRSQRLMAMIRPALDEISASSNQCTK